MGWKSNAINLFIYLNDWENVNHSCVANKYCMYVYAIYAKTYDHRCFYSYFGSRFCVHGISMLYWKSLLLCAQNGISSGNNKENSTIFQFLLFWQKYAEGAASTHIDYSLGTHREEEEKKHITCPLSRPRNHNQLQIRHTLLMFVHCIFAGNNAKIERLFCFFFFFIFYFVWRKLPLPIYLHIFVIIIICTENTHLFSDCERVCLSFFIEVKMCKHCQKSISHSEIDHHIFNRIHWSDLDFAIQNSEYIKGIVLKNEIDVWCDRLWTIYLSLFFQLIFEYFLLYPKICFIYVVISHLFFQFIRIALSPLYKFQIISWEIWYCVIVTWE